MKTQLLKTLTTFILIVIPIVNFGQAPNLGSTSGFALFAAVGAFSNIGAATNVTGNVGTNVGAFTAFPPGTLVGQIHVADPGSVQAAIDVANAYSDLSATPCGIVLGTTLGNGQLLTPDVYCLGAASTLNGDLILDGQGDPNALFIFKIDGALSTSTFSKVILINSASLCNVYWQINGAFDLGDNSIFRGTIVASGAISLLEGSTLLGRGLTTGGAISLHNNNVSIGMSATASVISAEGPTTICTGGSVILSGNVGGTWSDGSTTASITVTTGGDYFVTNTGDCGNVNSNHILVTAGQLPVASVITAGGPTSLCEGGSVVLSGNNGGTWSNGEVTPSITVTTSGDYYVTNTNACGSITSNYILVTAGQLPVASVIAAGGPTSLCEVESVILSGNNGGTWSNGEVTPSITVTTGGDYYVTNTNACGSVTSNHILVTAGQLSVASVITAGGPTSLCEGESVILSGNVGGTWSDGSTTASITVTTGGDYFVTNTGDCVSVNSNHILVTAGQLPVASVIAAGGPTSLCEVESVILSGNNGGTWSNGEVTPSITVTTGGDYYVTNTNACGSVTSNHILVTAGQLSVASVITAGGPTSLCEGESVILSGNNGGTWSNGELTPSITVTTGGDYYVTNTGDCGSVTSNHILVTVNTLPEASIISAGGPTTFCEGGNVILSGNVGGVWNNGATTPSITLYASHEKYVTNTNDCGSVTSNHIIVTVNPLPEASVITAGGPTSLCEVESVILSGNNGGTWSNGELTPSITVTTGGDYYVTNTGDCGSVTSNHILVTAGQLPVASVITAEGPTTLCEAGNVILSGNNGGTWSNGELTPSITVTTGGDYYVTNTGDCGSVTSNHILVTVNTLPEASIISAGGPTTFCEGGNVILSGNVGGVWNNGATTPSITLYASHEKYVTNTNDCGSVTSNHIIVTVNPLPEASVITAGGPTSLCEVESVILSGNNGGTWSNGELTPSITVTTGGDYYVTNTGDCGSVTSNHILVTAGQLPVASVITAEGPTSLCEGDNVILSGNNGGTWSNGELTPSITVTTGGDYYVTNTGDCGSVTSNHILVTVNTLPEASIISAGGPTTFCEGGNVILSGNVGGVWNNGATTPSITLYASHEKYVTNTNDCGSVTSNHIIVTVNPLPEASVITAGGPTSLCEVESVILSGNNGGTWSNGELTPSITVTTGGDYYVTNTGDCGSVTSNHILVTAGQLPVASVITAEGPTTLCEAGNVILSGNNGGTWSNGELTPSITVTTGGDYYVTNTGDCGSVTSNHILVTVNTLPEASIISAGGPTTFCEGGNVILSGNVGGVWNNGATTPSITLYASHEKYVTNTNDCGSVTSNHIIVTVNPLPEASVITAGGPTSLCEVESVILSGNNGGTWSNGELTPSITVTTGGDYYVTNTGDCGSVTSNHILVTAGQLPVASVITAEGPTSLCEGDNVILSGNNGGTWSNGELTPSITVTTGGDYYVTNTGDCGSVTSNHILVTVNTLPEASIISAGGPTTFCEGGNVILSGNVGGVWNNGATTPSITLYASHEKYVTNTNDCGSVTSNHIIVTVNPLPEASVITAGGPTSLCEVESVILSGNNGGTWSNGELTPSITVTTGGDYYVTNTGDCGSVTSNHILVTVNPLPDASIISANGATTICADDNVILLGNSGGIWNNGSVTPSITVNSSGDYFVTNINACGSVTSNHILVTVNQLPYIIGEPYNQFTAEGCRESFVVVANGTDHTYQWRKGTSDLYNGGNISGANSAMLTINPVYVSDTASNYNVVITGICSSVTSIDVSLSICIPYKPTPTSLDAVNTTKAVTIYPNPFTTSINVKINNDWQIDQCELMIYDELGREIMNKTITKHLTTLEIDNFYGVYFYRVISNNNIIQSGKLVKDK